MAAPEAASGRQGRAIVVVYLAGLAQGVAMVSFAASGAVLRARHGFSDTEYGSIFLPQVILAAVGAMGAGTLGSALGLRRILAASFAAMALSQAALAGSHSLSHGPAFAVVLLGTSLMGLGAGLSAPPLNTYPQLFFPRRRDSAVVAMHTAMGVGLAGGPLLVSAAVTFDAWLLFPLAGGAASLVFLVAILRTALPDPIAPHPDAPALGAPAGSARFWLFAAIAFTYAVTEATFSNWAAVYLTEEKQLGLAVGGLGLAAFWLALSAGRVLVGLLVLRLPAERVYLVLPILMAGAALLLGGATTPARAIGLFALAGLGCSAFFPLTVSLASRRFPDHTALIAAMTYVALVAGIGSGSFLTGALRARFPLATIYGLSALGPAAAFLLAILALRGGGEASRALRSGTGRARRE